MIEQFLENGVHKDRRNIHLQPWQLARLYAGLTSLSNLGNRDQGVSSLSPQKRSKQEGKGAASYANISKASARNLSGRLSSNGFLSKDGTTFESYARL
jgi:hypothetical protein